MWLFTQHGFFSATQVPERKSLIQIRARTDEHLKALKKEFPIIKRSKIIETPKADYRFRIVLMRWRWEKLAADLTREIDYPNFKGRVAVTPKINEMSRELHDVWHVMNEFQQAKHPFVPGDDTLPLFEQKKRMNRLFDDLEKNDAHVGK